MKMHFYYHLLWLFYGYEKNNNKLFILFTILIFLVKEDAFIYIIFFAIYIIFSKKDLKRGIILILLSLVYFTLTSYLLTKYGEGLMTERYSNLVVNNGGLFEVIKNIIINPAYALNQIMIDDNGSAFKKITFILEIFVPIIFIPFNTKKISNYILLFPLILINLLTTYNYQYDINFQYCFGSSAFIFYLCILNIKDMNINKAKYLLSIATISSILLFTTINVNNLYNNYSIFISDKENNTIINNALKKIPDNASIACSTFLLPHLSNRDIIYETYYHEQKDNELLDYVIIDVRYDEDSIMKFKEYGYEINEIINNNDTELLVIMKKSLNT